MKRVKRKETTQQNPQWLTNSNYHQDETDLFSMINLDLKQEILLKLRPKDVAKFMFVSKLWSSIIQTKYFKHMYMARYSPRLLVLAYGKGMQFLHSCSQKDPSSDHHRLKLVPEPIYQFSPPIRSLICRRHKYKVMVGNPSTGQYITLPRVKTWGKKVLSFFGYDPVNDLYKILCMTLSYRGATSEQHQVLSIGAKQKWRMVECNLPHTPFGALFKDRTYVNGICINGVVYYLASFGHMPLGPLLNIMSFDLKTEKFNLLMLPMDYVTLLFSGLVNHKGKLALGTYLSTDNTLDLCVLKDASQHEWSRTSFFVPSWTDIDVDRGLFFRGTLSTGEIILAPRANTNPFFLIYYDPEENTAKKVVIEGIRGQFSYIEVFLDHVESPMVLPKVHFI